MSEPNSESRRYAPEESRNDKSLDFLVEPADPVIFDPQPGGSDMPEPGSGSAQETTQPPETTE